jgi:hypothetical protein
MFRKHRPFTGHDTWIDHGGSLRMSCGWVDPDRGIAGGHVLVAHERSSMLGWVVEVEAALGCAGKGHMRFHKMAAPADELTSARCRVLTGC